MFSARLVATLRIAHQKRGCVPLVRSLSSSGADFRSGLLRKFVPADGTGFVGGKFIPAASGRTFDVTDPGTSEVVGSVADMDASDTHQAIAVAADAQKQWRDVLPKERGIILRRWYELMMENELELAEILMRECGKPLAEARGEIAYGARFVEWYAEEARRVYGEVLPTINHTQRLFTIKQPIGVAGMITPWNFPNAMITRKVAPALAAGCTAVIKPAEDTPLSALAICTLAEQAGVPPGAINIVTASRGNAAEVGDALCSSKTVRILSFTGSTAVGKHLYAACGSTVKKLALELGGNAPCIVFDDADMDRAIAGVLAAKFRFSGQTCVCANRIFVQSGVYDAFAEKFTAAVREMRVGVGSQDGVQLGPVINEAAAHKFAALLADARNKGAEVLPYDGPLPTTGHFCGPTVIRGATKDMEVATSEIFGPIAPLIRFDTEDEVVEMANSVDVGLAGYVFTSDVSRTFRVAEALEVGMVGVNEGLLSTEVAPFGGIKQSGLGREGSHEGIEEYLETKYMMVGL